MIVILDKRRLRQAMLLLLLVVMIGCWWLFSRNEPGMSLVNAPPSAENVTAPITNLEPVIPVINLQQPTTNSTLGEYRIERDRARSAQEELLRSASQDGTLSEERRTQLAQELLQLMQKGEQELQAETLLSAAGYTHAVVVLTKSGATVVLPGILTKDEAARIGDMVGRVCGIKAEQVIIMDAVGQP